jgi:hypothetical protein
MFVVGSVTVVGKVLPPSGRGATTSSSAKLAQLSMTLLKSVTFNIFNNFMVMIYLMPYQDFSKNYFLMHNLYQ